MRSKSHISAIALAAALLSAPQAAQAQLSIGVDVGGSDSGGLGVGVDLGVGGIGVDAGVDVGGDSLVDVDAGVDAGGAVGVDAGVDVGGDSIVDVDAGVDAGDAIDVDAGVDVGGDGQLIDADVNVDTGNGGAGTGNGGAGTGSGGAGTGNGNLVDVDVDVDLDADEGDVAPAEPLVGVRISALDDAARLDAALDHINAPDLDGVDFDDIIDDRRVSILAAVDVFNDDHLAEVTAAIGTGGEGRDQLLAALGASVTLGSILDREGIALENVISIHVDGDGAAELIVLDPSALGDGGTLVSTDLADLDIDLLTDDELAEIDLTLLPNEEQRLEAIIRLLGNGGGAPSGGTGEVIEIIDLDALLGDASLAEVDAVLGGDTDDLVLSADLLDFLGEQGLSPEAVVAVRTDDAGATQIFVDAGLGNIVGGGTPGGALGNLSDLDIALLTDEELARIDLALLPNEEQRLAALIRILGTGGSSPAPGGGTGGTGGGIQILDVDALLGEDALAELDLALNDTETGEDLSLSLDLIDALEEAGLSPEAVLGVRTDADGNTQIIVDAGLSGTDLVDVDLELGNVTTPTTPGDGGGDGGTGAGDDGGDTGTGGGDDGGDTGTGGDDDGGDTGTGGGDDGGDTGTGGGDDGGDTGTDGGDDGGDTGTGGGDDGGDTGTGGGDDGGDTGTGGGDTGGDGDTGTDDGGVGDGGSGDGGTGGGAGNSPGDGTGGNPGGVGNGGSGNGGTGTGGGAGGTPGAGTGGNTGGTPGVGGIVDPTGAGALTENLPAATLDVDMVVADVSCAAGLGALATAEAAAPSALSSVRSIALVRISGCAQTLDSAQIEALRDAVIELPSVAESLEEAGLGIDALVGGSIEGGQLTLYFDNAAQAV